MELLKASYTQVNIAVRALKKAFCSAFRSSLFFTTAHFYFFIATSLYLFSSFTCQYYLSYFVLLAAASKSRA